MINKAMFRQVQAFRRQGYGKASIVKALELDPKTVAEYFAMEEEDFRVISVKYFSRWATTIFPGLGLNPAFFMLPAKNMAPGCARSHDLSPVHTLA